MHPSIHLFIHLFHLSRYNSQLPERKIISESGEDYERQYSNPPPRNGGGGGGPTPLPLIIEEKLGSSKSNNEIDVSAEKDDSYETTDLNRNDLVDDYLSL